MIGRPFTGEAGYPSEARTTVNACASWKVTTCSWRPSVAAAWSSAAKIVVLAVSALVARAASAHRLILEKSLVLD